MELVPYFADTKTYFVLACCECENPYPSLIHFSHHVSIDSVSGLMKFCNARPSIYPCAFAKEKSLLEGFHGLWVCVFLNCSVVRSDMHKMKQVSYNLYDPEASIVIKEHMFVSLFGILVLGLLWIADLYCCWCSRCLAPHVTIFLHRISLAKLIK